MTKKKNIAKASTGNKIEYHKVLISGFFLLLVALIGLLGIWLKAKLDRHNNPTNIPVNDTLLQVRQKDSGLGNRIPVRLPKKTTKNGDHPNGGGLVNKGKHDSKILRDSGDIGDKALDEQVKVTIVLNGQNTKLSIDGRLMSETGVINTALSPGEHTFEIIESSKACKIKYTISRDTKYFPLTCD